MTASSHSPRPLAAVHDALAVHAHEPGALLPILHDVQDVLGYIPTDVVPVIAEGLNLSRAEVHGVVTYYHHFRDHPPGRKVLQICRAEACQSMGADALIDHARQHLQCELHGTTADGALTLEPVFCLGLCASSPAVMLGDDVHARMTPAKLDALVAEARSAA
jgi:formate dehydrogenase subunit gamma